MILIATIGRAIKLPLLLPDGAVGKFPRAFVYDEDGDLVAQVNLAFVAKGLYTGPHTPAATGKFDVVYEVYTDAGHTTLDQAYQKSLDALYVTEFAPVSTIVLGGLRLT